MSDEQVLLSEREMEIVQLLATGATNQQIAQELVISVNTVKVHLRNVYAKLNVASRTEATMVAVRHGWVNVPGQMGDEEVAPEEERTESLPMALPQLDPQMPISLAKRLGLVAIAVLAGVLLFLPLVLQGQTNGVEADPFGPVFPTLPSDPSADRWHTRAQMPTPRNGLAVAAHQDLIYAIGGVSNEGVTGKVEVYDPDIDSWATRSPKPIPVGFVSSVVVGDKIYVPGGVGPEREIHNELEIYDPLKDVWESGESMPVPLSAYGLAAWNDQIYLFGGFDGQKYVDTVFRYNPLEDAWDELESLTRPRGFLAAVALEDRIYVAGGYDDVAEFADFDAFDPIMGTWHSLASMKLRRGGLALVVVRDHLYAIGGGKDDTYLAFNEQYDSRVDMWNRIQTPVTEQWQGLGAAFAYPNIYAIGGFSDGNLSVNEAYQALFQIQIPVGP